VNEEGLLVPSVPDEYTKLCLVGEFNLIRVLLPLVDSVLDLILYTRYIGDGLLRAEMDTEDEEEIDGLMATLFAIFYVDDAYIASRDPTFLQRAIDGLVSAFGIS
jgi:hypothetical protein